MTTDSTPTTSSTTTVADVRDETAQARRTGVAFTGLAVLGLACTYLLPGLLDGGHRIEVRGFLLGLAVTLLLAGVLFGRVVPAALRAPRDSNRPARTGLITSGFALISVAAFWLGAPLVTAGAALALARRGQERSASSGGRGRATAAVVISVVVVVLTAAVMVNDALFYVGLGIHPAE
jgi:hypothetical protein